MAEILNPRLLLRQPNGRTTLFERLAAAGYMPQKEPFDALCNALRMSTPLLLEGQRGGGKTAFPEALARACRLPLFTLPCLFDTSSDHILFAWDSAGQNHFVAQEILRGVPLSSALQNQWSADFLKLGEVLDAFRFAAESETVPPVLLIDEIDKLSQDGESAFLQILARGYANVPKLRPDPRVGLLPEMPAEQRRLVYPIVFLTSNDMGSGVSAPLRSRSRYCFIPSPTLEETVGILIAAVPAVPPQLLYQTVKLINGLNGLPLIEKPALREFIMLLQTFHDYGYKFLTPEIIGGNIDCLAKTKKDASAVRDAVDSLFYNFVEKEDDRIHHMVRTALLNGGKRQ